MASPLGPTASFTHHSLLLFFPCRVLIACLVHPDKVGLADLLDRVLVDVERLRRLLLVELVDLHLLLDEVVSELLVGALAIAQRLHDILAHLLLLEVLLPLLHLEVLLVDLVQVRVHFLLLAQSQVLLVHLFLGLKLAHFGVLKFDLARNE